MQTRLAAALGGVLLLVAVVAYAVGRADRPGKDGDGCVHVSADEDIQQAIDAHPEDTRFCLGAGRHEVADPILPKNGNHLIGMGMSETFVVGTGAEIIIDAKRADATSVVVRDMDISASAGTVACKPACGSGFRGGRDNVIESVRFHDHPNHGIGGSNGALTVLNSVLDHNGSAEFVGCCAGGIKGGTGFTIRDSKVFSNTGVGIWCDVGCVGGMEVYDNHVYDNTRDGIRYEVSDGGAVIVGNVVENNNTSEAVGGHGGITSVGSAHAVIRNNVLRNNGTAGIVVIQGGRGVEMQDIVIVDNKLRGDHIEGCARPGVSCR